MYSRLQNNGKPQLIYHIFPASVGPSSWFKHSKLIVVFHCQLCCKISAICRGSSAHTQYKVAFYALCLHMNGSLPVVVNIYEIRYSIAQLVHLPYKIHIIVTMYLEVLILACYHTCIMAFSNITQWVQGLVVTHYHNLPKSGPPSRINPRPFFECSCCKGCFSQESMSINLCHSTCSYVARITKEAGLCKRRDQQMKADNICCYCITKCMTNEALQNHYMHAHITRTRLCVRWAYFQEKYHILFEKPLKGHIFKTVQ